MAVLIVPKLDTSVPTLGPQLETFLTERAVFGPGSLQGQPARLDAEKRAALYRLYEVQPQGHRLQGRRLFKRGGLEWRKGMAKTEFAAWVCFLELHPESPVRCDGFDAFGQPVGRPVVSPVIPMMAVTEEQVSELAYGVLKWIIEESPDADLFDTSLERIVRIDERGREDGFAVPVSNAPGSRDGARTTFQHFDEPHRLILPRHKDAHETMVANLEKRPLEDPWSFYTSTAGQPGQNSIEEDLHLEAEKIDSGEISDPALFFFARWAGPEHRDILPRAATESEPAVSPAQALKNRIAAVADATGPVGEYGPGQFEGIAKQWDRPKADQAYLERVWLNRWKKSNARMFDAIRITKELAKPGKRISAGAFITLGFDGARFRDSTALVATEIPTGLQELIGLWERPEAVESWEVDEQQVTDVLADAMRRFDVWKMYGDPPHWTETMGSWSGRWPDQIEEWWMNNRKRAAYAARAYKEAMDSGSVTFGGTDDPDAEFQAHSDFIRHLTNVGTKDTRLIDEEGVPLLIMAKPDGRMDQKIDAGAAGNLSWQARLDAIAAGAKPRKKPRNRIRRIR
jgi:hypothetical protein